MPYDYMGYDPETGLSEDGMSRDLLDRLPAVPYAGNPVMNMPDFSASPPMGGFGAVTTTRPAPVMPSPIPQELVEPPPLRLNIPETGEISPEHIAQFVGLAQNLHKQQRESQAAAIRYQGQLEYQQLINAGVPPDEAMRRTLPKIAYGHADTWTSTMQSTARLAEQERAKAQAERDRAERMGMERERLDVYKKRMEQLSKEKPQTGIMKTQLVGVNTRIRQAEGKMTANASEEQRANTVAELQALYDERDAIVDAIKQEGGEVAETARPRFEQVPQVATPPDMRSGLAKILPNFLGGSPPPMPVTNIVTRMVAPSAPVSTAPGTARQIGNRTVVEPVTELPTPPMTNTMTAPPMPAKSPYPEGTKLRSKKDGKMYEIRGGVPVLIE